MSSDDTRCTSSIAAQIAYLDQEVDRLSAGEHTVEDVADILFGILGVLYNLSTDSNPSMPVDVVPVQAVEESMESMEERIARMDREFKAIDEANEKLKLNWIWDDDAKQYVRNNTTNNITNNSDKTIDVIMPVLERMAASMEATVKNSQCVLDVSIAVQHWSKAYEIVAEQRGMLDQECARLEKQIREMQKWDAKCSCIEGVDPSITCTVHGRTIRHSDVVKWIRDGISNGEWFSPATAHDIADAIERGEVFIEDE